MATGMHMIHTHTHTHTHTNKHTHTHHMTHVYIYNKNKYIIGCSNYMQTFSLGKKEKGIQRESGGEYDETTLFGILQELIKLFLLGKEKV